MSSATTATLRHFGQFDPRVLQFSQQAYDSLFLEQLSGRRAAMVARHVADRSCASVGVVTIAMSKDRTMRLPAARLAQAPFARAYSYEFDRAAQNPASLGAIHMFSMRATGRR